MSEKPIPSDMSIQMFSNAILAGSLARLSCQFFSADGIDCLSVVSTLQIIYINQA